MRLYYLTAQEWAEKILREQQFKLSTFHESNDPFELQAASIKNRRARRIYRDTIYEHWSKNLAMLCASTEWHSPVMWAHYGDKHRGVCIGFDTTDAVEVSKVTYEPDRLDGLLDPIGLGQLLTVHRVPAEFDPSRSHSRRSVRSFGARLRCACEQPDSAGRSFQSAGRLRLV